MYRGTLVQASGMITLMSIGYLSSPSSWSLSEPDTTSSVPCTQEGPHPCPLAKGGGSRHATHPSLSMCTLPRRDMNTPRGCRRLPLFESAPPLDTDRLRETRMISVALPACITRSAQLHQPNESTRLPDTTHHQMAEHMLRLVKVP